VAERAAVAIGLSEEDIVPALSANAATTTDS
jgi:hypothetical protein